MKSESKHTPGLNRVDRLNAIHAEWMALDPFASEKEKQRVFKLMEEMPKSYLSVTQDGRQGVAIVNLAPLCQAMPAGECLAHWGSILDNEIAWQNGKYIPLATIAKATK